MSAPKFRPNLIFGVCCFKPQTVLTGSPRGVGFIQRTSVRPKDLLYLRTLEDVMKIPEPMIPLMTRAIALVAPNSFLNLIFLEEGGIAEETWRPNSLPPLPLFSRTSSHHKEVMF